jgi:hypothetical protein
VTVVGGRALRLSVAVVATLAGMISSGATAANPTSAPARATENPASSRGAARAEAPFVDALDRAVAYYADAVSDRGAYKQAYDLALSQRDGRAQMPFAADVGLAYVAAYEATGDRRFLPPAQEIAALLERDQIGITGGWWHDLYVNEQQARPGFLFFRSDEAQGKRPTDNAYSVLRDDKTAAALRFLMRLDRALGGTDLQLRRAVSFGLAGLLKAQYPSGGYPDVYYPCSDPRAIRCTTSFPSSRAQIPPKLPTRWPGTDVAAQTQFSSLNDGTTTLTIETLLEAWSTYGQERYRAAALRTADWLVRAQFPEPQPGWSQVYDAQMNPAWDRIYEPPALSTRETAYAIKTLLDVYRLTGDNTYLRSARRASNWLAPLGVDRGATGVRWWPMFVQFGTNKPLFVDPQGVVSTDQRTASAWWQNYGWWTVEDIASLPNRVKNADSASCVSTARRRAALAGSMKAHVRQVVRSLDPAGRWVTNGQVSTDTFVQNVKTLAAYLGLVNGRATYLDANSIIRHVTVAQDDPCRYIGASYRSLVSRARPGRARR